jgi:hypothetical protein
VKAACVGVLVASLAWGCHSGSASRAPVRAGLTHVVVFWLKTPGDAEARRRIVDASEGFRSIPGVVAIDAGQIVPTPRPNVDKTYDVAVVIRFRDREALEQYQVHPKHKATLQELGPLIDHTVVYDFE